MKTLQDVLGFSPKYTDIEHISEDWARELADEVLNIKGFNCYLLDIGGAYGYSILVYKNNHHIYYADDYQLHHPSKTVDELRAWYIETLNHKLYTDDEIISPLKDYDDYTSKSYFLSNYYGMQEDYVSAFYIVTPESKAEHDKAIEGKIYNPVCYSYYDEDKADFITHHIELKKQLEQQKKQMQNDFEYMKQAFLSEMWNHEYGYNWQADYDVLSCFGSIQYNHYDDMNDYFNQLNFTDDQRRAYREARREYYSKFEG